MLEEENEAIAAEPQFFITWSLMGASTIVWPSSSHLNHHAFVLETFAMPLTDSVITAAHQQSYLDPYPEY